MDLISKIEEIRSKPDHVKAKYAFWSSFGITAVIFVFWLASFSSWSISPSSTAVVEKTVSPSQSLVAAVGSFFGDIKDMIFGPKKINYSVVEVKPGK